MSRIPTSTSVTESAVIAAPFSDVWHLIKLPDFAKFWSKLEKAEEVKGTSPETDVVKWTFKDGTVLEVKQEEHSVSLHTLPPSRSLAWDVYEESIREDAYAYWNCRPSTIISPTASSPRSPR